MTAELNVYILQHRYEALNTALYGEGYGFGERILDLEMESGQRNLDIKLPVLCRYENNVPVLQTNINRTHWRTLYDMVATDVTVKVILNDGRRDHLAKLKIPGSRPPRDGGVEMRLCWKETDDSVMEKGVRWIKRRLLPGE
jgi:hypothetical protein